MTRRHIILAVAVLALIGVNARYWWPQSGAAPGLRTSAPGRFLVEDFALKTPDVVEEKARAPRRDPFRPYIEPKPLRKKSAAPAEPPPKTPEQLAEEAARAELAQIKLMGVVFRGGHGQAYLVKGDQAFMVSAGDKVGDRFTVESVSADKVQLKDPKTNVSGEIPVSGK